MTTLNTASASKAKLRKIERNINQAMASGIPTPEGMRCLLVLPDMCLLVQETPSTDNTIRRQFLQMHEEYGPYAWVLAQVEVPKAEAELDFYTGLCFRGSYLCYSSAKRRAYFMSENELKASEVWMPEPLETMTRIPLEVRRAPMARFH